MTPLDAARAHAEIEIRKLSSEINANPNYWTEIEDDDTVPRFYWKARDYVNSLFSAYVEMYLKPDVEDPMLAIDELWTFLRETADYLWTEHGFQFHTQLWNVLSYPKIVETWPVRPEKLSFDDFWSCIWLEARPGEQELSERHRAVIDDFWQQRASLAPPNATKVVIAPPMHTANRRHDEIAAERSAAISAYKREGMDHGIKITDVMIARAASTSWNERTPVARWKKNDPRCTSADDLKIRKVLVAKPHIPKPSS